MFGPRLRSRAVSHEARLAAAGIELPAPMPPAGLYVSAVVTGDQLHVGGHGPIAADGTMITGKVGTTIDLHTATHAARLTGLQILAAARAELGSLDRIVRAVTAFGMDASDTSHVTPTLGIKRLVPSIVASFLKPFASTNAAFNRGRSDVSHHS